VLVDEVDEEDEELADVDEVEPALAVALVPTSSPEHAGRPTIARESSEEAKIRVRIPLG
jgi:hypothetical protein